MKNHYFNPTPILYNITPYQVSQLLGTHIRTAQSILKDIRGKLGKGKMAYVSVQEFCRVSPLPEADVLAALQYIPPDPDDN